MWLVLICDECGKPDAKKYLANWLCEEHGRALLIMVGWLKPKVILTKTCQCDCHIDSPFSWCDNCWNDIKHGLQKFPIKAGMTRANGTILTPEEVTKSLTLKVLN